MNQQQAENLRILIRHMEGISRTLNMSAFFFCNTPACALGEATTIPEIRQAGLISNHECFQEFQKPFRSNHHAEFAEWNSVFGLTEEETERVFGMGHVNAWNRRDVAPQEWAAEARKVLAENGYSMDAPDDGFAAFRAKVLEPIAVTA